MKIRCRLNWHNWRNWQITPATSRVSFDWIAGQLRQCADCLFMEAKVLRNDTAFNMRPLREAIRTHVDDLRRCIKAIEESEISEAFNGTRNEIAKAANELQDALLKDEGQSPSQR